MLSRLTHTHTHTFNLTSQYSPVYTECRNLQSQRQQRSVPIGKAFTYDLGFPSSSLNFLRRAVHLLMCVLSYAGVIFGVCGFTTSKYIISKIFLPRILKCLSLVLFVSFQTIFELGRRVYNIVLNLKFILPLLITGSILYRRLKEISGFSLAQRFSAVFSYYLVVFYALVSGSRKFAFYRPLTGSLLFLRHSFLQTEPLSDDYIASGGVFSSLDHYYQATTEIPRGSGLVDFYPVSWIDIPDLALLTYQGLGVHAWEGFFYSDPAVAEKLQAMLPLLWQDIPEPLKNSVYVSTEQYPFLMESLFKDFHRFLARNLEDDPLLLVKFEYGLQNDPEICQKIIARFLEEIPFRSKEFIVADVARFTREAAVLENQLTFWEWLDWRLFIRGEAFYDLRTLSQVEAVSEIFFESLLSLFSMFFFWKTAQEDLFPLTSYDEVTMVPVGEEYFNLRYWIYLMPVILPAWFYYYWYHRNALDETEYPLFTEAMLNANDIEGLGLDDYPEAGDDSDVEAELADDDSDEELHDLETSDDEEEDDDDDWADYPAETGLYIQEFMVRGVFAELFYRSAEDSAYQGTRIFATKDVYHFKGGRLIQPLLEILTSPTYVREEILEDLSWEDEGADYYHQRAWLWITWSPSLWYDFGEILWAGLDSYYGNLHERNEQFSLFDDYGDLPYLRDAIFRKNRFVFHIDAFFTHYEYAWIAFAVSTVSTDFVLQPYVSQWDYTITMIEHEEAPDSFPWIESQFLPTLLETPERVAHFLGPFLGNDATLMGFEHAVSPVAFFATDLDFEDDEAYSLAYTEFADSLLVDDSEESAPEPWDSDHYIEFDDLDEPEQIAELQDFPLDIQDWDEEGVTQTVDLEDEVLGADLNIIENLDGYSFNFEDFFVSDYEEYFDTGTPDAHYNLGTHPYTDRDLENTYEDDMNSSVEYYSGAYSLSQIGFHQRTNLYPDTDLSVLTPKRLLGLELDEDPLVINRVPITGPIEDVRSSDLPHEDPVRPPYMPPKNWETSGFGFYKKPYSKFYLPYDTSNSLVTYFQDNLFNPDSAYSGSVFWFFRKLGFVLPIYYNSQDKRMDGLWQNQHYHRKVKGWGVSEGLEYSQMYNDDGRLVPVPHHDFKQVGDVLGRLLGRLLFLSLNIKDLNYAYFGAQPTEYPAVYLKSDRTGLVVDQFLQRLNAFWFPDLYYYKDAVDLLPFRLRYEHLSGKVFQAFLERMQLWWLSDAFRNPAFASAIFPMELYDEVDSDLERAYMPNQSDLPEWLRYVSTQFTQEELPDDEEEQDGLQWEDYLENRTDPGSLRRQVEEMFDAGARLNRDSTRLGYKDYFNYYDFRISGPLQRIPVTIIVRHMRYQNIELLAYTYNRLLTSYLTSQFDSNYDMLDDTKYNTYGDLDALTERDHNEETYYDNDIPTPSEPFGEDRDWDLEDDVWYWILPTWLPYIHLPSWFPPKWLPEALKPWVTDLVTPDYIGADIRLATAYPLDAERDEADEYQDSDPLENWELAGEIDFDEDPLFDEDVADGLFADQLGINSPELSIATLFDDSFDVLARNDISYELAKHYMRRLPPKYRTQYVDDHAGGLMETEERSYTTPYVQDFVPSVSATLEPELRDTFLSVIKSRFLPATQGGHLGFVRYVVSLETPESIPAHSVYYYDLVNASTPNFLKLHGLSDKHLFNVDPITREWVWDWRYKFGNIEAYLKRLYVSERPWVNRERSKTEIENPSTKYWQWYLNTGALRAGRYRQQRSTYTLFYDNIVYNTAFLNMPHITLRLIVYHFLRMCTTVLTFGLLFSEKFFECLYSLVVVFNYFFQEFSPRLDLYARAFVFTLRQGLLGVAHFLQIYDMFQRGAGYCRRGFNALFLFGQDLVDLVFVAGVSGVLGWLKIFKTYFEAAFQILRVLWEPIYNRLEWFLVVWEKTYNILPGVQTVLFTPALELFYSLYIQPFFGVEVKAFGSKLYTGFNLGGQKFLERCYRFQFLVTDYFYRFISTVWSISGGSGPNPYKAWLSREYWKRHKILHLEVEKGGPEVYKDLRYQLEKELFEIKSSVSLKHVFLGRPTLMRTQMLRYMDLPFEDARGAGLLSSMVSSSLFFNNYLAENFSVIGRFLRMLFQAVGNFLVTFTWTMSTSDILQFRQACKNIVTYFWTADWWPRFEIPAAVQRWHDYRRLLDFEFLEWENLRYSGEQDKNSPLSALSLDEDLGGETHPLSDPSSPYWEEDDEEDDTIEEGYDDGLGDDPETINPEMELFDEDTAVTTMGMVHDMSEKRTYPLLKPLAQQYNDFLLFRNHKYGASISFWDEIIKQKVPIPMYCNLNLSRPVLLEKNDFIHWLSRLDERLDDYWNDTKVMEITPDTVDTVSQGVPLPAFPTLFQFYKWRQALRNTVFKVSLDTAPGFNKNLGMGLVESFAPQLPYTAEDDVQVPFLDVYDFLGSNESRDWRDKKDEPSDGLDEDLTWKPEYPSDFDIKKYTRVAWRFHETVTQIGQKLEPELDPTGFWRDIEMQTPNTKAAYTLLQYDSDLWDDQMNAGHSYIEQWLRMAPRSSRDATFRPMIGSRYSEYDRANVQVPILSALTMQSDFNREHHFTRDMYEFFNLPGLDEYTDRFTYDYYNAAFKGLVGDLYGDKDVDFEIEEFGNEHDDLQMHQVKLRDIRLGEEIYNYNFWEDRVSYDSEMLWLVFPTTGNIDYDGDASNPLQINFLNEEDDIFDVDDDDDEYYDEWFSEEDDFATVDYSFEWTETAPNAELLTGLDWDPASFPWQEEYVPPHPKDYPEDLDFRVNELASGTFFVGYRGVTLPMSYGRNANFKHAELLALQHPLAGIDYYGLMKDFLNGRDFPHFFALSQNEKNLWSTHYSSLAPALAMPQHYVPDPYLFSERVYLTGVVPLNERLNRAKTLMQIFLGFLPTKLSNKLQRREQKKQMVLQFLRSLYSDEYFRYVIQKSNYSFASTFRQPYVSAFPALSWKTKTLLQDVVDFDRQDSVGLLDIDYIFEVFGLRRTFASAIACMLILFYNVVFGFGGPLLSEFIAGLLPLYDLWPQTARFSYLYNTEKSRTTYYVFFARWEQFKESFGFWTH